NTDPIYGVELDPETLMKKGEPVGLIQGDPFSKGFERVGENNSTLPLSKEECLARAEGYLKQKGSSLDMIPEAVRPMLLGMFSNAPYIEGAWMDKYNGKYYLQYACPGTQYNTYGDGVYVSDSPFGPFKLAENNPYSYKPGGFFTGAGHGSTMEDLNGNIWHISTMRISMNHIFERRVGLWKAGYDKDGELFCNQRYGDWPIAVCEEKELHGESDAGNAMDPWADPKWYLLSYQKKATASSFCEGKGPELIVNENNRNWWRAADHTPQWVEVDLGEIMDVHAVQMNFADDHIEMDPPGEIRGFEQARYIEERDLPCRYLLKASADGVNYDTLLDASEQTIDLSHDFYVCEEGHPYRYVRLEILEVPYGLNPCISGLRVFGIGNGTKPQVPVYMAERIGKLDMKISIDESQDWNAQGFNILWGSAPDKLYHSWLTYEKEQVIGALVAGRSYYVRVDAFNENGITEGQVQ
nr:family 43 glycosylhydrolase [Lachnospiraceae bacterium]